MIDQVAVHEPSHQTIMGLKDLITICDLRAARVLLGECKDTSGALIVYDVQKLLQLQHVYMLDAKIQYDENIEL